MRRHHRSHCDCGAPVPLDPATGRALYCDGGTPICPRCAKLNDERRKLGKEVSGTASRCDLYRHLGNIDRAATAWLVAHGIKVEKFNAFE